MAGGQPPKKQTSRRKTGMRRSHLFRKLALRVNAKSPVQVRIGKSKPAGRAKAKK